MAVAMYGSPMVLVVHAGRWIFRPIPSVIVDSSFFLWRVAELSGSLMVCCVQVISSAYEILYLTGR